MKNIYNILEKNPVVVAPMAGFTNLYFREAIRENGGFLAFSEMVSTKALCFNDKKTFEATGCKECNNIGYLDRIGVFEVLVLNIDESNSIFFVINLNLTYLHLM